MISWVVFGLIAGAIAKLLMPGKDPGGWIITAILGIAGAFVGGWIAKILPFINVGENWSIAGFLAAVGGAVVLLGAHRFFVARKHKSLNTSETTRT